MFTKLLYTLILFASFNFISAQTNPNSNAPSDATTGYTYNYDKVFTLVCNELLNKTNVIIDNEANVLIGKSNFPKIGNVNTLTTNQKTTVANWIQANGNLVIEVFKNRKDIVTQF
jgi:hypothetical protein